MCCVPCGYKFYICPKKRSRAEERTERDEKNMDEAAGRGFSNNGGGNRNWDAAEGSGRGNGWKNRGGVFVNLRNLPTRN